LRIWWITPASVYLFNLQLAKSATALNLIEGILMRKLVIAASVIALGAGAYIHKTHNELLVEMKRTKGCSDDDAESL
jgi:predicted membrane-bound spermidine synthase